MTLIEHLTQTIADMASQRRVLVGIDGPDAAGKTTLSQRLAQELPGPAIRASIEGFHHHREFRMARGWESPEGYYRDSFNLGALEEHLLAPFLAGAPMVRTRVFDFRNDSEVESEFEHVPPLCTLIVDGVFLLRPELRRWWDLAIYVHVSEEVTLARALERDAGMFGSREEAEYRYRARYLPGQAMYRQEAHPQDAAHIVIDNSDAESPVVRKWDVAAHV